MRWRVLRKYRIGGVVNIIRCSKKELKNMRASEYPDNTVIIIDNRYWVWIKYTKSDGTKYDTPSLLSYVEIKNGKKLNCTPGSSKGFTPYYIDNFKGK